MHDTAGQQAPRSHQPGRGTRCSRHAASPAVGTCSGCGRALCLACAIPVRGLLVGSECLSSFVEDAPVVEAEAGAGPRTGDLLAGAGFALVLALTVLPWTRFANPRPFGAWAWHWSLLAPVASLVGLVLVLRWRARPIDPRVEAGAYGSLAVAAALGATLYRLHPPLLAGASMAPELTVVASAVALAGAVRKGAAFLRRR